MLRSRAAIDDWVLVLYGDCRWLEEYERRRFAVATSRPPSTEMHRHRVRLAENIPANVLEARGVEAR